MRCLPGRSAFAAFVDSSLAATIKMAELMKSVIIKSEMHISAIEYFMQLLMAEMVGR